MTKNSTKFVTAVLGGAAVITMGTLAATGGPAQTLDAKSTSMTVGATTTEAKPSNVPATSMAVPAIKGPAALPAEEQAAE